MAASTLTADPPVGDLGRLAGTILSDLRYAPPGELSRVVDPTGMLNPTGGARASLGPTGLGTSAARLLQRNNAVDGANDPLPALFCPGPLRDNPALGREVNDRVVAWAQDVGIYRNNLDRLRSCDFGRFMMLSHPATDDPDRLVAATKCLVAEWAADDYYVDEVSLGADPMTVGSRLAKLHAIVDPARLPRRYAAEFNAQMGLEPIAVAFRSAMEHLAKYASVTQMARFQHQMAILFLAWTQEADWHANGRTPSVWEYLVQRHLNSYLPPMILVDVVAGYELAPQEFYHPLVREAYTLAGDANVLLNDLYSGAGEADTDHNLGSVLTAEEGLTRRETVRRTVELHNELMHRFVAIAAPLSSTGSPQLRRFFADTWAWLGGSRQWHATTGRYHDSTADHESTMSEEFRR